MGAATFLASVVGKLMIYDLSITGDQIHVIADASEQIDPFPFLKRGILRFRSLRLQQIGTIQSKFLTKEYPLNVFFYIHFPYAQML